MVERRVSSRFVLSSLTVCTFTWLGCGPSLQSARPVVTPMDPPIAPFWTLLQREGVPPPPARAEDRVSALIAEAERHFRAGQDEMRVGHSDAAQVEFDRAVGLLSEPRYGEAEPRVREYRKRLITRISAYDLRGIADPESLPGRRDTPATIDELLALSATLEAPLPAQELRSALQSDLAAGGHDIGIPLNDQVLSYIALFQGRLHDFIEVGMKRATRYLPMIQSVFRAEGLPLDLAYVPLIESAFDPNALSRAKARGVWQFMAGTALENGLRSDWFVDERSDPAKATVAAARYLKTLVGLFSGDWHLALASYNGGPGRVQKAIKRVGSEDFWALSANATALPRETREYVPMILAAIVIARNPVQYGFDIVPEPPAEYEGLTVTHPVDLRRVALWAQTTLDEIQDLNPELLRWTTPLKDTQYELRVPMGTAERVSTRMEETPEVELVTLGWYTVVKGDTLTGVARKLRVTRSDLAQANDLKITALVVPGQKLMIPREVTPAGPASVQPIPVASVYTPPQPALDGPVGANRPKVSYVVQEGDTLFSIARLFRTTVASLQNWNGIDGSFIAAGNKLTIYTDSD
jgi:membrane-bound lytic murein transglycosylase D